MKLDQLKQAVEESTGLASRVEKILGSECARIAFETTLHAQLDPWSYSCDLDDGDDPCDPSEAETLP